MAAVYNINQSINYPYPERRSVADSIIRHMHDLAFLGNFAAPKPAKPRKGDKVSVTLTGYVGSTDDYGFTLVDKRTPFGEEGAEIVGGGPFNHPNAMIRIIERRPSDPKVGDEISGATVRATPWKRGTMLRGVTYGESDRLYVLTPEGQWHSVKSGRDHDFADVYDDERYRVEHAPGK